MDYQIIHNLPIDFYFTDKSKDQLKLYGEWFKLNKTERLNILFESVRSTRGFENWQADFSPDSLKQIGLWLKQNVKSEKLSDEAYKAKRKSVPEYIKINDWDLTNETYSKLIDVGIYLGETFIKNYKHLKWEQYFSKIKDDSNQGHMVIKGFDKLALNPLRALYIIGLSIVNKKSDKNDLYELYKTWESYLK